MKLTTAVTTEAMNASTLRWWRDAGVDVMIDETPRQWLIAPAGRPQARVPAQDARAIAPTVPVAPAAAPLPATRDALVTWLVTAPEVTEGGSPERRVAPSGDPAAELMVLADFPDSDDADAGHLLSGTVGDLFDKMLAAIELDRSKIYLASLAPGRPPTGQLNDVALAALSPIARHHIALVAPKRLWLLGLAASRAILGISDVQAHGKLHLVNLNGRMIDTVVTAHPRFLTDQDKKRRAWTEMQRLTPRETA